VAIVVAELYNVLAELRGFLRTVPDEPASPVRSDREPVTVQAGSPLAPPLFQDPPISEYTIPAVDAR